MTQEKFKFGNNIIKEIVDELNRAKKYIKIVVFQIHNKDIINKLIEKVKMGVSVEVITLPFDSIDKKVREEVTKHLKQLEKAGAKLNICDWNIGDTSHTKTVSQDWYCLHAKFIVTDKSAIGLSANLTMHPEFDAILVYDSNEKIAEFNNKFDLVKDLFMNKKIKENIEKVVSKEVSKEILTPLGHITTKNSVLHYPTELCPDNVEIEEKLYVFPFDCKGRNFMKEIINDAEKFIYISSERFTDEEFYYFLEKMRLKGIDIKVLAKFKSQDYQHKIVKLSKNLLALGVDLKNINLMHAKLVITDKLVALGSINLNKMNLGFRPRPGFWRANTEVMTICKNPKIIEEAKQSFLDVFNSDAAENVLDKMVLKESDDFGKIIKNVLDTKHYKAKQYLSEKYIKTEIENRKRFFDVIIKANELRKERGLNKITEDLLKESEVELEGKNPQTKL